MKKEYNFGWGNSVCVRKAFVDTYNGEMIVFSAHTLEKFDYPNHEGDLDLIKLTKEVMRRQIGHEYKHVIMTNGATGGCVVSLRAYKQQGFTECYTREAPYYIRYPKMIEASGLSHSQINLNQTAQSTQSVLMLDIPSNPLGLMNTPWRFMNTPLILDGVYFNKVYVKDINYVPMHDVFVGSYSKLLGINGIRMGWIATNDDILYERIKQLITSEYCGLSTASSTILNQALRNFDWDIFEKNARAKLDLNRENWSKLNKFFGDKEVPEVGMFWYVPMDSSCKKLLEKTGIIWTKGSEMGTNDNFGRLNLGQDCELTEKVTKLILKNDRIT